MTAQTKMARDLFGASFAARHARKIVSDALHPPDPTAGLVCVEDKDEMVEHPRTKEFLGVRRVRTYARKDSLMVDAGIRYDDQPIELFYVPTPQPTAPRRPSGFLRHWRGNRPADR